MTSLSIRMKQRPEGSFWSGVIFFCLGCLCACAQTPSTNSAVPPTNAPSQLIERVQRLSSRPLTFNLDQIAFLRENTFLGEPLWKYVASLIYLLLAFYVSKLIDFIARVWLGKI